jgi:putative DNA primase/helicase
MRLVNELPGIFNWALEGLRRLRQNGRFTQPKQVLDAREQYKSENDTEAAFIADWCVCDEKQTLKSSELYRAYQLWCARNGHRAKGNNKVGSDWKRLGFEALHTREGNAWRGIGLNAEALTAIGFSGSQSNAAVKADF